MRSNESTAEHEIRHVHKGGYECEKLNVHCTLRGPVTCSKEGTETENGVHTSTKSASASSNSCHVKDTIASAMR